MASPLGFVLPAASIGLGAIMIRPRRGFFPFNEDGEALAPIIAQATIEERHHDELMITEHPVEQGATIADHAYKLPAEVIIRCAWSNSPSGPSSLVSQAVGLGATLGGPIARVVAGVSATVPGIIAAQSILSGNAPKQTLDMYQKLLKLQSDRIPFDILTGKRSYSSMLLQSLAVETNELTENSLMVVARCKQVIIVSTQPFAVSTDPRVQSNPEKTSADQNLGSKSAQPQPPNYANYP